MKAAFLRIYENEYIEKAEKLLEAGAGASFSDVCKKACLEGLDVLYSRAFDKASQVSISEKLEEIERTLIEHSRRLFADTRENMLIAYSNRQLISIIYNLLLGTINGESIDVKSVELGLYDEIPERIIELFEQMNEDIK